MTKLLLVLPLLIALLTGCGGGGEEPTPTSSPAVILPSPTPEPTAEPTATPEVERKQRLIFLRLGVIHMSDLNGSNVIQLTPGDVQASFVGLAEVRGRPSSTTYLLDTLATSSL